MTGVICFKTPLKSISLFGLMHLGANSPGQTRHERGWVRVCKGRGFSGWGCVFKGVFRKVYVFLPRLPKTTKNAPTHPTHTTNENWLVGVPGGAIYVFPPPPPPLPRQWIQNGGGGGACGISASCSACFVLGVWDLGSQRV